MAESRKLVTILSLDVAGYSHAAEMDDAAAAQAVRAVRGAIGDIVTPFGGRVFNTAGDGFMVEFASAAAAVDAAMALLAESLSGDRGLPRIRIGLHLGDVFVEANGDLLGHGVNVAARLQALAEPGTAAVSGAVRAQLRATQHAFQPRGRVQLDKMDERIEVFLISPGVVPAFEKIRRRRATRYATMAAGMLVAVVGLFGAWRLLAPPAEAAVPTLAVLQFDGAGGTSAAFAESFSAELHYVVSRVAPRLQLIGRASSFTLSGDKKNAVQAREMLHATHVLAGSVTRENDKVVATVELIDTTTNLQIWRDRMSDAAGRTEHLLARISERAGEVLKLTEKGTFVARPLDPRALDLYFNARVVCCSAYVDQQRAAIEALQEVVRIEPTFVRAWIKLAEACQYYSQFAPTKEARVRAEATGKAALGQLHALAPNEAETWVAALMFTEDPRELDVLMEKARAIDPSHPKVVETQLSYMVVLGRGEEATALVERALTFNPLNASFLEHAGFSALITGDLPRAEAVARRMNSVKLWHPIVMSWLSRGDFDRAKAATDAFAAALAEIERNEPARPTHAWFRARLQDGRDVYAALQAGAAEREALAERLVKRVVVPVTANYDERIVGYINDVPAIAMLAGADRAFDAWGRRIDSLPPYDETGGAHVDDVAAWFASSMYVGWARLHRDKRYWTYVARFDREAITPPGPQWPDTPDIWPPSFCKARDMPYDCTTVARAAFAEAAKTRVKH